MTQLAARAGGRFGSGRVLRGRKPGRLHHIQAQGKCASRRRGALIRPAPANGTATVKRTASIAFGSCRPCATASVPSTLGPRGPDRRRAAAQERRPSPGRGRAGAAAGDPAPTAARLRPSQGYLDPRPVGAGGARGGLSPVVLSG